MAGSGYKDYFQVLGVDRSADANAIKKAFRSLARQYHPDVNPGDAQAEARVKEISEAYEVLSDRAGPGSCRYRWATASSASCDQQACQQG